MTRRHLLYAVSPLESSWARRQERLALGGGELERFGDGVQGSLCVELVHMIISAREGEIGGQVAEPRPLID